MTHVIDRRSFLKLTSVTGAVFLLTGCGFVNRVRGKPQTGLPIIENAWTYSDGTLSLDLEKLPELKELGGAVRIEGAMLPDPILIVNGYDQQYHGFKNACTHGGRKIDPVTGRMKLRCCSVGKSIFDYEGNVLSGPAKGPLTKFPLTVDRTRILIGV